MVVHYLRFSSRSARNVIRFHSRKFSASSLPPKQSSRLRWVPLVVGGACVAGGALEYIYPKSITGFIVPVLYEKESKLNVDPLESQEQLTVEDALEKLNKAVKTKPEPEVEKASNSEKTSDSSAAASLSEEPIGPPAECVFDYPKEWLVEEPESQGAAPESQGAAPESQGAAPESQGAAPESQGAAPSEQESKAEVPLEVPAIVVPPSLTPPFEIPETLVGELEDIPSAPETVQSDTAVTAEETPENVIETLIDTALASDPLSAPVEDKLDEAEIIMDALHSLDYEPVLSDTVLDLLVGKAANREKAVIATISRLENAMANVVNEVNTALEHHNKTSTLVTSAKLNAQSISKATSKDAAKDLLDKLLESSSAVRQAFEEGEEVSTRVADAFNKLSEVIEKAEQFNLKGPVGAARTLLSKSRTDYYTSCEIAQENQVDHALVSHYQKSVVNRKKVLNKELEILREHFPKQHIQLNQTFDSAEGHSAQVDELNTLITYLSNKVGRLETELEDQQTAELKKLKTVAEAQKADDAKILEERLKGQAEQLRYKYELQQQGEVDIAVAAARDEAARHAAKQADILKEEMTEAAERQIRDITSFWSDEAALRESVVEVEYQCKLEKTNSTLCGVAGMLDVQSQRYHTLLQDQRLLNLTTALFDTINSGETVDSGRLQASVDLLRSEYSSDPLISAVTATIPDNVRCYSFSQLKDRLGGVEGACRKVALVTTEDCGIGSHILSRALSALTLHDDSYDTKPEEGGSVTLYCLSKADSEMKNNNLDLATRYLNQLVGKPRSLAMEWLKDARTLLEMRQSASVLLNYAKSKNHS